MPPARSPRTEPASPEATIGHDGAVTGAAAHDQAGTAASLRALARLLARQAAAEYWARNAAAIDGTPDAPIRDAA